MREDEPRLLGEPDLMMALLRGAGRGAITVEAAMQRLETLRRHAGEAPADALELRRALNAAARMLIHAGALAVEPGDRLVLTERGRALIDEHLSGVDQTVLMRFPEFRAFIEAKAAVEDDHDDPRVSVFDAGMNAFLEGRDHTDNPYALDSIDHLAWENGWFEARDEARRT